jgi:ABC-2 type transport system permease protein
MKYLVLVNPLVYVSEGMRGAITPTLPHMPLFLVTGGLLVITLLFWWLGIRSFNRRAIS